MDTKINFLDLKLTRAVIELRYDKAFELWDRAGTLWTEYSSMWPDLKPGKIEPSDTSFILENQYDLAVTLDKAHIIDHKPSSNLENFIERSDSFSRLVCKTLEILFFNRIGFRLTYTKAFSDKLLAANAVTSTKNIHVPEGRHFNINGKVSLPGYLIVWEGESAGIRIGLRAQDRKIDFEAVPGVAEIESIHLEKHELVYDVDYYTLGKVSIDQLNLKDWIQQIYHLIRRDSNYFLGDR
jgi:hypothetical protein